MADTSDMFPKSDQIQTPASVEKWYFVTNQRNLFYMLGTGMLMPPSGFGDKYYQDTLNCFPGWLPLFPNKVSKAALDISIEKAKHLIPCILEVDISSLRGPAMAIDQQGKITQPRYPEGLTGNEAVLLLPVPLPATWIATVIFESKAHKDACIKDASDFDNVDLSAINLKNTKGMFDKETSSLPWPQQSTEIQQREVLLEKPLAAGAVLAMLSHLGNSSDLAIDAARLAYNGVGLGPDRSEYRIVSAMKEWMLGNELGKDCGLSAKIYWNLVEGIVQSHANQEGGTTLDVVLGQLEKARDNFDEEMRQVKARNNLDEEMRQGFEKLVSDLKGISGFGDHTITELFERHTKPLPRSLLIFFLRESCSAFLDFRHELLNEYDYVLTAILFGARGRWLGLPTALRSMPGLKEACCHRMAVMSHQIAETSMDLGTTPARPESLRELLTKQPQSVKHQEAVTLLARESGWDCIRTRISISKGDKFEVDGDGTGMIHFILNGEPKAVRTEADYEAVLQKLVSESIPAKLDFDVRALLKGKSA